MKKILLVLLTFIFGTLLVGCTGTTNKPLATKEEIKSYKVLNIEEQVDFIQKVKKNVPKTVKIQTNFKFNQIVEGVTVKLEFDFESYVSNNQKEIYINFKKHYTEMTSPLVKVYIDTSGDIYLQEGKMFFNFKGKLYSNQILEKDVINKKDINLKAQSDIQELFGKEANPLEFNQILSKYTTISRSENGKLFAIISDEGTLFVDKNFNIKQFVLNKDNVEIVTTILETNVVVPLLTEDEKDTYPEGKFDFSQN